MIAWLENSEWADSWAFRILKSLDPRSWVKWGRWSDPSAQELDRLRSDNEEQYWRGCIQWKLEHAILIETHARENGVLILGDIPLYVAHDSADMWNSKSYQHRAKWRAT